MLHDVNFWRGLICGMVLMWIIRKVIIWRWYKATCRKLLTMPLKGE